MPEFMGMVARAQALTADKDWAAAADLWAGITAANPVNGDYWARLGEARFGARDYAGARQSYERVLRLGVREAFLADDAPPLLPGEVAYRIACCEAAAGDGEAAVTALKVALDRGMRDLARVRSDEHWADLRDDQRVRDMVGIIDAEDVSRDDGWRPAVRIHRGPECRPSRHRHALERRRQHPAVPAPAASSDREQAAEPSRRAVRDHRPADISAAQNTVTAIELETSAIFVGEPTGSRPDFIGERIDFELACSKVQANAGDFFWQTSWPSDFRPWVAPDIYAPPTFAACRRNQDPAMDAILALREHVPG